VARLVPRFPKGMDRHRGRRRRERIRGLGNTVVPQVAEWIGKRILDGVNRG
jgi:site-specific DNA-cytosine methylase